LHSLDLIINLRVCQILGTRVDVLQTLLFSRS
jgi:hypothetical protein